MTEPGVSSQGADDRGTPDVAQRDDSAASNQTAASTAEGTGETVGEAKWAALRELERRFPGLESSSVRFAVLSEGERGILGVGYAPARVVAEVTPRPARADAGGGAEPGTPAARLRELLERICTGLSAPASVVVSETESALVARLSGRDVGLLIGKRGQTIDAIQQLANALLWRESETRKEIVVDAAGYRRRRETSLARSAEQAAHEAVASGAPVVLEPMTAAERKIVHLHLQGRADVTTASEGSEPNRRVVVSPAAQERGA